MGKRVLVIPKGFIGDIILISPVFEALKRSAPDVHITALVPPQFADLVGRDIYVDEVIRFDRRKEFSGFQGLRVLAAQLKAQAFDVAYAFQRSPRTALLLWLAGIPNTVGFSDSLLSFLFTRRIRTTKRYHEVIRQLEVVQDDLNSDVKGEFEALTRSGPAPVSNLFSLRVPDVSLEEISAPLAGFMSSLDKYVVIAPGSAWQTKMWRAEGFREVASGLIAQGYKVVVVGAPDDSEACAEVCRDRDLSEATITNLCGRTSLSELIYVIKGARGVICNDSLALHLASATKVPAVAIFCATSPQFGFGPWKNRAIVVEKGDLFCKPCRRHGSRRCPTGTYACMRGVTSTQVLEAFADLVPDDSKRKSSASLHVV